MKPSPARTALVLLFVFIGCFGAAYAAAGMLTALPAPAVGGTCGPSTSSETALEALAKPGSIGAGPEPPVSNVTAHHQWSTFIQQCQSLADRRGLASLAVFVLSLAVAAIGLIWVLRKPRSGGDGESVGGSDELSSEAGPGGPSALVGAGAVAAGPPYAGVPSYPAPYAAPHQAWSSAPAPPPPYPYGAPSPYPSAPAHPPQPPSYPSAPAPTAAPPYPPAPLAPQAAPSSYAAPPPPPPPPPPPYAAPTTAAPPPPDAPAEQPGSDPPAPT